uniref:ARAD1B15290p n=1 Tax=Blastobotrys adeninivorans TaxID=409370 RepID=A0A060TBE7_BLAAD
MTVVIAMHNSDLRTVHEMDKVQCIFLARFDVHEGNTIVWSKSRLPSQTYPGLEFRAIPSGLHQSRHDVVYFIQPQENAPDLEGVAVYRQNNHPDRDYMEMYSLGVLCRPDPSPTGSAMPNAGAWGYVPTLDKMLAEYMDVHSPHGHEPPFDLSIAPSPTEHPILATRTVLSQLGPLVFSMWKTMLLRKRLLLIPPPSISVETACRTVYVLSCLGTIPTDVWDELPHSSDHSASPSALYNVSLSDISWLSDAKDGYIAVTRDSVLQDKKNVYDMLVPSTSVPHLQMANGDRFIYPNYRDCRRFNILLESIALHPNHVAPPASIFVDTLGPALGGVIDRIRGAIAGSTVSGFLWWASAGEQDNGEAEQDAEGLLGYSDGGDTDNVSSSAITTDNDNDNTNSTAAMGPSADYSLTPLETPLEVTVLGYFHHMTRSLFRNAWFIIQDYCEQVDDDEATIVLEKEDLRMLGLDPGSGDDAQFATEFFRLWFNKTAFVNHRPWYSACC